MRRVRMTPQQHDADAATISHLPHALAAALMHTAAERGGLQIASTGFAGATRLASSNPPMRADIMRANRPALKQALAAMRAQLDELEQHLTADQPGPLLDWLELAKSSRRAWQAGQ
jgi:prephenate dehydrogenase